MSKLVEWPVEKVWRVWKTFHDIYAPDESTSEMSMENELMTFKLRKTEDPMDLNDRIAGVSVKYGCIVEEKENTRRLFVQAEICIPE